MKSQAEIHAHCVNQVCEYYAAHRDLLNGAAGTIEPKEVVCTGEENNFKGGYARKLTFVTKSADGMMFQFTATPHFDATKVTMEVYRLYDVPKEVSI